MSSGTWISEKSVTIYMNGQSSMEAYRLLYVNQIAHGNLLYASGNPNWVLSQPRGVGRGGRWT